MYIQNTKTNEIAYIRDINVNNGFVLVKFYQNKDHYDSGDTNYVKGRLEKVGIRDVLTDFNDPISNDSSLSIVDNIYNLSYDKLIKKYEDFVLVDNQ